MTKRRVVESFAPIGGRVLGFITLGIGALVIADIVIEWRTLDGLTAGAVVVALGTLVWMSMIRPSVVAYEEVLVIRNLVRDTWIPWRQVEGTDLRPVLQVNTAGASYRSIAVGVTGADRRAMYRNRRDAARGLSTGSQVSDAGPARAPRQSQAEHAAHRIEVMAKKYADNASERTTVERTWAWPEIAVFAVATVIAVLGTVLA